MTFLNSSKTLPRSSGCPLLVRCWVGLRCVCSSTSLPEPNSIVDVPIKQFIDVVPHNFRSYLTRAQVDSYNTVIGLQSNINKHPLSARWGRLGGGFDDLSATLCDRHNHPLEFTFIGEVTTAFITKDKNGLYRKMATINVKTLRPQDGAAGWHLLNSVGNNTGNAVLTDVIQMFTQLDEDIQSVSPSPFL